MAEDILDESRLFVCMENSFREALKETRWLKRWRFSFWFHRLPLHMYVRGKQSIISDYLIMQKENVGQRRTSYNDVVFIKYGIKKMNKIISLWINECIIRFSQLQNPYIFILLFYPVQ